MTGRGLVAVVRRPQLVSYSLLNSSRIMPLPVPVGERTCPHCETAMNPIQEANGLRADWCPRCGATWFERGQLARVRGPFGLGHEDEDLLAAHVRMRSTPLVCPTCDTETLFRSRRGVRRIAHCRTCGGFVLPSTLSAFGISLPIPVRSRAPVSSRVTAVSSIAMVIVLLILAWVIAF